MSDNESYNLEISPNESFDLANEQETEHFQVGFDDSEDMELGFGDVHRFNEADFNRLYNRPSYGGQTMTGDTNIPRIIIDDTLSDISTNPVQNRVIYSNLETKVESSELAPVAFSGEYNDLTNEPVGFTQEEWDRLWTEY